MSCNLSGLYNEQREVKVVNALISLTQKECYRPKLEHLKSLLEAEVALLSKKLKNIFVIAGTNGKGETAHCLKYLLEEQGSCVALWSSPHVLTILERLYHGEKNIDYDCLESLLDRYSGEITSNQLSFYESLFFIYIKYLVDNIPDYLILEVGLGGRFDAVNIFDNALCAITSISLDHTQILGSTLKQILGEKYGITRKGGNLTSALEQKHLKETLKSWCLEDDIELCELEFNGDELYFERNQDLALSLFEKAGGSYSGKPCWPVSKGRREKVTFKDRDFIFIGAHNLDGHRKMLEYLRQAHQDEKICTVLSFSTGREQQVQSILKLYDSYPCLVDQNFVTNFQGDRSISNEELKELLLDSSNFELDWNRFFSEEFKYKKIVITGSYFFIAKFQEFLLGLRDNTLS